MGEREGGLGGAAAGDNLTEPFNISEVVVVAAVPLVSVFAVVVVRLPVVVAVKLSFPL